jgi:aminopeptidase
VPDAFVPLRTMTDPRIEKLADVLINYSCAVEAGEKILIEAIDVPHAFTKALVKRAAAAGGKPIVMLKSNEVNRALMHAASPEQWDAITAV